MTSRFDWGHTMRIGLGALALPPEVFWSMTPREFEAAVRGRFGDIDDRPVMTSVSLEQLIRRFPDKHEGQHEDGSGNSRDRVEPQPGHQPHPGGSR